MNGSPSAEGGPGRVMAREAPPEEVVDDEGRRPQRDRIVTQASLDDLGGFERLSKRIAPGCLPDVIEHGRRDAQPDRSGKDDPLRVEQVQQGREARAKVAREVGGDRCGCRVGRREGEQRLQPVRVAHRLLWRPSSKGVPATQDRGLPDVGLQAAPRPAPARLTVEHDGGVAPFAGTAPGPPIEVPLGEHRGPDPDAQERDHGVRHPQPRAEPQLGLAHRLRAVVHEDGAADGPAQQAAQRQPIPAEARGVDLGVLGPLDDARDAHPDAQQLRLGEPRPTHHVAHRAGDALHDRGWIRRPGIEVDELVGTPLPGQVERFHAHPALAEVHTDGDRALRPHPEDGPGTSAARLLRAVLRHQPLIEQLRDDSAHGPRAETGRPGERLAAGRPAEQQLAQDRGPVRAAEVSRGGGDRAIGCSYGTYSKSHSKYPVKPSRGHPSGRVSRTEVSGDVRRSLPVGHHPEVATSESGTLLA